MLSTLDYSLDRWSMCEFGLEKTLSMKHPMPYLSHLYHASPSQEL